MLSDIRREQRNDFVMCLSNQGSEIAKIIFQGRLGREVGGGNSFDKTTFYNAILRKSLEKLIPVFI